MPSGKMLFLRFTRFRPIGGGNDKRRFRFVYALAEPIWMDSVLEVSKVGDILCARFFWKYASLEEWKEDFPQNRPPARSCTSVKPGNTFANETEIIHTDLSHSY